jgi:tRNA(Leu) C34 or U34 (ribose-2'-O)-methylase TrmL
VQHASPRQPRLGIDIGRVIITGSSSSEEDTAFFDGDEAAMLATPEVPGAVDSIARLVRDFDGRVWLISKCGPTVQARTLRWLAAHDFYARTGISPDHVRFCRARADKRVHCVELGLTHFVDDHPEVHAAIQGTVEHQYFFGPQQQPVPDYGTHTPTWQDVQRSLGSEPERTESD